MEGRSGGRGCRFMSCFVPAGCCSSCLRPSTPLDDHAVPAADEPASHLQADDQPASHQIPEITLTQLDAIIPLIQDEIDRLDPAKSSNSSSQAPISQRLGNMLAQWEAEKQICTSLIRSLPSDLQNEVAENGKSLVMPLLTNALGSMGAVHWLGIGFAFIAWSLDNISSIVKNQEDCIGILRRSLRLLRNTKEIWQTISPDINGSAPNEDLQDSVEKAFRCAVFCVSTLSDVWLLRFVKANTVKDAIDMLRRELEEAYSQNTALTGTLVLQNQDARVERQVTLASTRDDIVGGQQGTVMDDAMDFLKGSSDVLKVALLHGMGGIGKSTLAMRIFTEFQKSTTYKKGACRVELPLETRDEHLSDIQRQILEKLVGRHEFNVSNTTDGKGHMEKELSQLKHPVFLYVDNVMEQQHLSKSLPKATFFPKGSRILITSRSKYATLHLGVISTDFLYKTFEVGKLQREQAQRLLWKQLESNGEHRDAVRGVDSLEEEVLALCDGLPLALVVVGKYILGEGGLENVGIWHKVVTFMKKAEPLDGIKDDELYSRIKFSVEKLDENVKASFLDVVFLLDSRNHGTWEDVERLVSAGHLNILHQRALVQKGQKSNAQPEIHDVLKTLGRIMIGEDTQELRIMGMDQLDNDRLEHVVALCAQNYKRVDVNLLRQMRNLRFLVRARVTGDQPCEETIQLRKLRVVERLEGSISSVNIDWSKCHSLKEIQWKAGDGVSLKVFRLDSLSKGLESLRLESWEGLKDVEVLQNLKCLKKLELVRFAEWKVLPQGICNLVGLQHLDLSYCKRLQSLPDGLASLTSLTWLRLYMCTSLKSLPEGLANLTGLTRLELTWCVRLQYLPDGLENLTGLTWLGIVNCVRLRSLPDGLASLTGLTTLDVNGCLGLQSLPDSLTSLTSLTVRSIKPNRNTVQVFNLYGRRMRGLFKAQEEDERPDKATRGQALKSLRDDQQ